MPRPEPVVRIRCGPEDERRCLEALERAGLRGERSLTWLVVRDADPDAVNEALVAGGAARRVAVREAIGKLVGWLLDKGGQVEGRAVNLQALVSRALEDGGLAALYAPRPGPELVAAARAEHERLMATGASLLAWDAFVAAFCVEKPRPPAG